jgi:tetratricopeptide (TPR) repeat protein
MESDVELWYARAHYKLGQAYRTRGRLERARAEYERVLRISPRHYDACKSLGETCFAQGDLDAALTFFQRAHALRDDDPLLHLNLGRVLLSKNRQADAAEELARALHEDPENPEANYFMGRICLGKKEYRQAISHMEKALSAKEVRHNAQLFIGKAQIGLGEFEEATATLRELLREDPANIWALDSISTAYRCRGMEYEAVKYFRRAISMKTTVEDPADASPVPQEGRDRLPGEIIPTGEGHSSPPAEKTCPFPAGQSDEAGAALPGRRQAPENEQ